MPVNILDHTPQGVAETSLAENVIRERMTPTDECLAFLHFLGVNGDIDAVAMRLGQTRRYIEGRLRLATLAEPIFDTLASGKMTMEVAKAYAATPDRVKQLAVFEEVKDCWLATNAHEIRKRILGASISASHPVAVLVGEARYTEAGGRVVRELFTEADAAEWLDGDLAVQLAATLMEVAAAEHAEASGIGRVIPLLANASTWSDREALTQARLERAALSPEAEFRIAEIQSEQAQFQTIFESTEMDDAEVDALNQQIEALEREEADLRGTEVVIDDGRKTELTQFIVIGDDGTPRIEPGYWETPRARASGHDSADRFVDPKKAAAKSQGLTGALADELAMARRDVLALHIASDPSVALNFAIFTLAENAMGRHSGHGCSLMVNRCNDPTVRSDQPESSAESALGELRKQLGTDWADHPTTAARFDAFCALEEEVRASWLAVCVASSIEASIGGKGLARHNPFHDHLGQLLDIQVAAWWRPSAGGYFARVRKAGMQRALGDIGGPVLSARYASAKSAEMADACEKLCNGNALVDPEVREAGLAWLPAAMRFDSPDPEFPDGEEPGPCDGSPAGVRKREDEGEGDEQVATGHPSIAALIAHYDALKIDAGDAVLLFRVGDFYEILGADATRLADLLDIALTSRNNGEEVTPMVGIPVHASDHQIARLIQSGLRVAIAEPVEGGARAIVRSLAPSEAPTDQVAPLSAEPAEQTA